MGCLENKTKLHMNLKKVLLLLFLSISSHAVMAQQCNGPVVTTPGPSLACNCGSSACDGGGIQLNSYTTCGNVPTGGISCATDNTGVIGDVITCTAHYNIWAIGVCIVDAGECALICAGSTSGILAGGCIACLGRASISREGYTGLTSCTICGNIVTCSSSSSPYPGAYYSSITGTCPPPAPGG
jgi:hypothetical protein